MQDTNRFCLHFATASFKNDGCKAPYRAARLQSTPEHHWINDAAKRAHCATKTLECENEVSQSTMLPFLVNFSRDSCMTETWCQYPCVFGGWPSGEHALLTHRRLPRTANDVFTKDLLTIWFTIYGTLGTSDRLCTTQNSMCSPRHHGDASVSKTSPCFRDACLENLSFRDA